MLIGEIVRVALSALRANKLRSVLTMLGIVIGVAAVIAVVALGRGAQNAVKERIASLGTTLLTVRPARVFRGGVSSSQYRAHLWVDDGTALQTKGTIFAAVEPEMTRQLQVQFRDQNTATQIIGTTPNYLDVRKYTIAQGKMFTQGDDDGRKRVAVIGATVASDLAPQEPPAYLLGQSIRIRGIEFTVIGITAPKGGASSFNDPDDQVLIPLQTAQFRVFDEKHLNSISVLAQSEKMIPATMTEIERILRREHRLLPGQDDDFQIRDQADFLNTFAQTTQVFSVLLIGIATVSLLVGGIGIMNIMLVSVTERTREVGIRKALGATRSNIMLQFLIEAIVLCLVGGVIGMLLGAGGAYLLRTAGNFNTAIGVPSIVLAFFFSALVGVVFGVWPARRAARLDPIESLRYE
ncbi:MAG TPA: ABC transporter permease [Gemmatimonadaceae bacterium]|nr:ABC transporter permease [Gemmatimonadaceae bacterium]